MFSAGCGAVSGRKAQGVYGKDVHFEDGFKPQGINLFGLSRARPPRFERPHLRWETADPERRVPSGSVIIQVDRVEAGNRQVISIAVAPRNRRYSDAVEWAARQPSSNRKVGLLGISYSAVTQWRVATLQPRHLAAICPWRVTSIITATALITAEFSAAVSRTIGGQNNVCPFSMATARRPIATDHRRMPTGDKSLTDAELIANRTNYPADILRHRLDSAWSRERSRC